MLTEKIVEKVKNGEISFLGMLSDTEAKAVIRLIIDTNLRDGYIKQCFRELKKEFPEYVFLLVYDLDEYKDFCMEYLKKDFSILFDRNFFCEFIGSVKWGEKFIIENMEALIVANNDLVFLLMRHGLTTGNKELLNNLINSDNLFVRGLSLYELIYSFPHYFFTYCPDVIGSLAKYDEDGKIVTMVDVEIASKIAFLILDQGLGYTLYNQVKEYIFNNYKSNILGSLLAGEHTEIGDEPSPHIEELHSDMTRYFLTSKDYKYQLYKMGEGYIDEDVYLDFKCKIEPFAEIDEKIIEHIFSVGLGDKFFEFVQCYLEKSTSAVVEDLGSGSVTRTIRIGDYVIKCSSMKWDMPEDPPTLFLFAKDYEYEYVRDSFGVITGALEVQKYYRRAVTVEEENLVDQFLFELALHNYVINDEVRGMGNTPNLFHLDSYKDAQYSDERYLPEWFKKDPIVWVDIDMIHKLK